MENFANSADAKPTIIVRNFSLQQQMIATSIIATTTGANIETKISKIETKMAINTMEVRGDVYRSSKFLPSEMYTRRRK